MLADFFLTKEKEVAEKNEIAGRYIFDDHAKIYADSLLTEGAEEDQGLSKAPGGTKDVSGEDSDA